MTDVKICGLSTPETLQTAIESGARFVGFVFYPPSPRHVSVDIAANLARSLPTGVRSVGLFVDPDDETLVKVTGSVPLDMIQLHGDETPERVSAIKALTHLPVMKAIRVASAADLEGVEEFENVADWLLFDTKLENADLPGGTGHSFDWNILAGREFKKPWMLAGGVTAENVTEALSILSPNAVDVSSGVESSRGVKDSEKIRTFIQAVKNT